MKSESYTHVPYGLLMSAFGFWHSSGSPPQTGQRIASQISKAIIKPRSCSFHADSAVLVDRTNRPWSSYSYTVSVAGVQPLNSRWLIPSERAAFTRSRRPGESERRRTSLGR